ncbi:MAG: radical SAM protein [Proteobacteria bacterium]|nr:radical SAM protein [Pseudomonadota bacterium]MBU4009130.1 radical SAM protein [Pseudomonadota bacterium]
MKVLLVRPHAYLPTSRWLQSMLLLEPYAQELIAGAVQPPHDVRICDLAVQKQPLKAYKQVLKEYRPDFIGFGGFSGQYRINRELAGIAKEVLPQVLTCLGGIHVSSYPTDCKAPELFDIVVRGDGVSAIKVILKAMESGQTLPETDWILPTASPNFDQLAVKPPPPLHSDGINTRPRRDLVDMNKYYCICYGEPKQKMKTLFPRIACVRTSVGCPNRCSFCVVHFLANGKYLQRNIEDVVDEIASLPQEYIYFVDDETFTNAKRMSKLAEMLIERGIKKKYLSWARSDTICRHPELFELWKRAGLELVYIGFESLEEKNLTGYNKNATPSQNRKAREILRNLNLNIHAALMINPDFDKEDFEIVHKAIEELSPAEFAFTVFSPPPGTEAFADAKDSFICDDPCLYYDCLHTILPTKLPLKTFYRYFSILYALGAAKIPPRINKVKVPIRDFIKLFIGGLKLGRHLHRMYRDYDRKYW